MLFFKGLGAGFFIAAPVGVIGLLCIENTLMYGMVSGLVTGLGAATADMMYGLIVAFGLGVIADILLQYKNVL